MEEEQGENVSQSQDRAQALQGEVAALKEQMATQNTMIQQLLTQLVSRASTPSCQEGSSSIQETTVSQERKKSILPKLQEFDGKRSEWAQWYQQAKLKLEVDGVAIGDKYQQFAYIYTSLRGSAA